MTKTHRPYGYISEVLRDALDPTLYVARLASRAEGLTEPVLGAGKTTEGADTALRQALKERLGRDPYPINVHVLTETYWCGPCKCELVGRAACNAHRRGKHGATGNVP